MKDTKGSVLASIIIRELTRLGLITGNIKGQDNDATCLASDLLLRPSFADDMRRH